VAAIAFELVYASQPASAGPPRTTTLIMDRSGALPSGPVIADRGHELLVLDVRAPRAVRLEGNVDPVSAARAAMDRQFPLNAGETLIGYQERPDTFCAPIATRGLTMAGPCLVDEDGDGRFEAILKARFSRNGADQILLTASSKVVGTTLDWPVPLAGTVPYTRVEYSLGHSSVVRLNWSSNYRSGRADRPVEGTFWFDASARFTGTGIVSRTVPFLFSGQPETVAVGGITVRILGFEPTGAIRYEIVAAQDATPVEFAFRAGAVVNYVVIYR
jgi:hypothetical protein